MSKLTYNPGVFAVPDETAAKAIILTPQAGQSPEERWVRETPYLIGMMEQFPPPKDGLLIDYGCGIGRMAKEIIARFGCRVLGVDISQDMRGLAPGYVGSSQFSVVSPALFYQMVANGLRADAAIAIWVLQHTLAPDKDIALLERGLRPGAPFFVVNNKRRAIPTQEKAWANDGVDVRALLQASFDVAAEGDLDPAVVGQSVTDFTFYGHYRRR